MMPTTLVERADELATACEHLASQKWVALDTEFMRERTYYAQLCLIQIATPERIMCIDPLAVDDLDPLLRQLHRPDMLKILHSARQDLEVFFDLTGSPLSPVFDTQIAASLVGFEPNLGYAALVKSVTDVHLAKAHTRANWAARPLKPALLNYAADDVRYLRDVYANLSQRLAAAGREDWLREDCERLTDARLYQNRPEDAYLRIKQGQHLAAPAQQILRQLAAWRERTAQQKNLPRAWVVSDAVLIEVARKQPQDVAQFASIQGVDETVVARWGQAMVNSVVAGMQAEPEPLWPSPVRLSAEQKRTRDAMLAEVERIARAQGLSAAAIVAKKDVTALVLGHPPAPLTEGWRHALIGRALQEAGATF